MTLALDTFLTAMVPLVFDKSQNLDFFELKASIYHYTIVIQKLTFNVGTFENIADKRKYVDQ